MASPAKSSVTTAVGKAIHKELAYMRTQEALSTFCDSRVKTLITYQWDDLWEEANQCCPTLTSVLSAATKYKGKAMQTATMCTIVAMLLKLKTQKANMVQTMISCMLYGGGCSMKVCTLTYTSQMTPH
jgi:hypothetical protein